jgi:hypothetical protein
MKKDVIIKLGVGVALAFVAYQLFFAKGKKFYAQYLVNKAFYKSGLDNLLDLGGEEFLKAWYEAAKINAPEFTLNGKTYITQGGKAK